MKQDDLVFYCLVVSIAAAGAMLGSLLPYWYVYTIIAATALFNFLVNARWLYNGTN